jgi:hypothetical protein
MPQLDLGRFFNINKWCDIALNVQSMIVFHFSLSKSSFCTLISSTDMFVVLRQCWMSVAEARECIFLDPSYFYLSSEETHFEDSEPEDVPCTLIWAVVAMKELCLQKKEIIIVNCLWLVGVEVQFWKKNSPSNSAIIKKKWRKKCLLFRIYSKFKFKIFTIKSNFRKK